MHPTKTTRRVGLRTVAGGCFVVAALAAGPASCGIRSGESNAAAPKLVWSDEFSGLSGTQPNPKYWNYETGGRGFGNNELQCYTTVPGNIAKDGLGRLVITSIYQPKHRCVDGATNNYTSARITTQKKFTAKYGRLQIRAKVPAGVGTWPAFWALGNDHDTIGWPRSGEIDVMEYVGRNPGTTLGTLHGPTKTGAHTYTGPRVTQKTPLSATFHTWAATWSPTQISWSVDGKTYGTITKTQWLKRGGLWVFDKPFYLLVNLAIGGNLGGPVSGNATASQRYIIDYVRVYR